jgi:hypothetical protein
LSAGGDVAQVLRAEIATVLKEIDAGSVMLRAAMEESDEQIRRDVINAVDILSSRFDEMGFLIQDVEQAAAEIQQSLALIFHRG